VSRRVPSYLHAARAQRLAGLLLAACCACLAASALGGREASTILLVLAVLCLTMGELLKAAATWQITFALAPRARAAEFFATFGLGRVSCQVAGPVLVTAVVLALGSAGWLLLAAVFVIGGFVTPPLARRARLRPVASRTPRGGARGLVPLRA
jgi:dipeptide/tripeptide permease